MLDFEVRDPVEIDERLRGVVGFEGLDAAHRLYAFRRRSTGRMPDLFAKVEPGGLYICDNGLGRDIMRDIRAALADLAPAAGLHKTGSGAREAPRRRRGAARAGREGDPRTRARVAHAHRQARTVPAPRTWKRGGQ